MKILCNGVQNLSAKPDIKQQLHYTFTLLRIQVMHYFKECFFSEDLLLIKITLL